MTSPPFPSTSSTLVEDSIMQNACQDLVTSFTDETNFLIFHGDTNRSEEMAPTDLDEPVYAKSSKIWNAIASYIFGERFHFRFFFDHHLRILA